MDDTTIVTIFLVLFAILIGVVCVDMIVHNPCAEAQTDWILNPANPASPTSPLNPMWDDDEPADGYDPCSKD